MVSEEGWENSRLNPSAQQLRITVSAKAANIRTEKGKATHPKAAQLWYKHLQMCPKTLVVAGPNSSIFLSTCIAGSCNYKRSFACQLLHAAKGCHIHEMSINIVNLPVISGPISNMEYNITGKRSLKACRLVHVIPNAHYPHIREVLMTLSPPFSYIFPSKIRKSGISGPYLIDI